MVHHSGFGNGRFVYIAVPDNARLARVVAEHYTGTIPLQVSEPSKQLYWQSRKNKTGIFCLLLTMETLK